MLLFILESTKKTWKDRPNLLTLQLILYPKRDEIINIFSQGSPQEKTKAVNEARQSGRNKLDSPQSRTLTLHPDS